MKNIQPYLLPAAVLVLALTQVPQMRWHSNKSRCVDLYFRSFDVDKGAGPVEHLEMLTSAIKACT